MLQKHHAPRWNMKCGLEEALLFLTRSPATPDAHGAVGMYTGTYLAHGEKSVVKPVLSAFYAPIDIHHEYALTNASPFQHPQLLPPDISLPSSVQRIPHSTQTIKPPGMARGRRTYSGQTSNGKDIFARMLNRYKIGPHCPWFVL